MDAAKAKVVAVVLVLLSLGIWENYRLRLCCNWYKGWWVGAVLGILGLFNFIGLCLCVLEVWKACRLKYCRQKPVCMCVCVKQRVTTECVCVCVCVWGWGFRVYLVNVLFSAPIFLFKFSALGASNVDAAKAKVVAFVLVLLLQLLLFALGIWENYRFRLCVVTDIKGGELGLFWEFWGFSISWVCVCVCVGVWKAYRYMRECETQRVTTECVCVCKGDESKHAL